MAVQQITAQFAGGSRIRTSAVPSTLAGYYDWSMQNAWYPNVWIPGAWGRNVWGANVWLN